MTITGIIACVLACIGQLCVGMKWRIAFVIGICAEVLWSYEAIYVMQRYDLLVVCGLYCIVATNNWRLWGKK